MKSLPRFSDTTASVLLDAIRGVAALLVLLEHWRNVLFVDYHQVGGHRILLAPLYIICAAGHQAVIIFFVLSGYLIGGSVLKSFRADTWAWSGYLTHRFVRLWTVLLPALLLGAFWDHLGIWLGHAPGLYSGITSNHMTPNVQDALSIRDFVGNLAFVQTIWVPTYGSNGALWSLAYEFWYYLLFPLIAVIVGRRYATVPRLVFFVILGAAILTLITRPMLLLFIVWLFGASLHFIPSRSTPRWLRAAASVLYVLLFFGISMLERNGFIKPGIGSDIVLGLGTLVFVWVLLGARQKAPVSLLSRIARSSARFSFTLYAVHTPILTFLVSIVVEENRWLPGVKTGVCASAILIGVIGYAWLVAAMTEFKTDKVRSWVERWTLGGNRRLT